MTNYPRRSGLIAAALASTAGMAAALAGPPLADYGDAPDGIPACGIAGGIGMFPTVLGTGNAAPGRDAPYHVPMPMVGIDDWVLGLGKTEEGAAFQPSCDWMTPGCDVTDDGPLVLCLTPACTSGWIVGGVAICDIGGDCFGPSPGLTPMGYWVLAASAGPFAGGPSFVNVTADWDLSGTYGDNGVAWCLRDALGPAPFTTSLYTTLPFPVLTVAINPDQSWALGPFWNRFQISTEPKLPVFDGSTNFWDGSGPTGGLVGGETEDKIPLCDPGVPRPVVPTYCFDSNWSVVVTLDPADTTCQRGVQVNLSSAGLSPALEREFRVRPYNQVRTVLTELVSLDLRGLAPRLGGPVQIRESPLHHSWGLLRNIQPDPSGGLLSADSFFDVFADIELPQLGRFLTTAQPLRLGLQGAHAVVPVGQTYFMPPQQQQPVPLIDQATGQHSGWICSAAFTPTQQSGCQQSPGCDYNQDGGADNSDVTELANDIASGTQTYSPSTPDYNQDGGADNSDVSDLANDIAGGRCP